MGYEPRLITFFQNGLVKYYKPWLISNEAFPEISNAYAWRGSIRKREGFTLLGTLPGGDKPVQGLKNWLNPATLAQTTVSFSLTKAYRYITTTNLFQDISFLANPPGDAFSFMNGPNDYYWSTNYAGSMWVVNNVAGDFMRFWDGDNGVAGISGGWSGFRPTVNGVTQMTQALIILPYKGRLVVLNTTEGGSNFQSRARWSQIGSPYTGNRQAVAVNNAPPGTGITPGATTIIKVTDTTTFTIGQPAGVTNVIGSIASVLNFNQFNVSAIVVNTSITLDVDTTGLTYTSGGTVQGPGRTIQPVPFEISIFGWRDDIPGRGGYIDADTSERIVSAEIVKDVLIVFFQRSTWRLRYTGNEILPFIWERLNTQYGAESTYSNIAFDEAALAFSRYGWIAASTNDVARIDQQIPDDCFSVVAETTGLTGLSRIQGIRDYFRQFAYWTFPAIEGDDVGDEADEIYAYNYIDKSWSIFTPSVPIRVFGTYSQNFDETWSSLNLPTNTWANFNTTNDKWENFGSSQNIEFPQIVSGDANGNVYIMFEFGEVKNTDNGTNFGFDIKTKRFNPYIEKGLNCRIGYVDIYSTTIPGGEVTFNHYINDQSIPVFSRKLETFPRSIIPIFGLGTGVLTRIVTENPHGFLPNQLVTITDVSGRLLPALINNNTFPITIINSTTFSIPLNSVGTFYTTGGSLNASIRPNSGSATYTRVYLGALAHMHQFEFTLTEGQIADPLNGTAQFELQGMVIWSRPTGMIRG